MIKTAVINAGKIVLNAIYSVQKTRPLERRVVFLSRQSNKPSLDITLLSNELNKRNIETVVLCNKMDDGLGGIVRYIGPLFKQMRYLACSKVAILDSYCIPVCILKKRDGQSIVQMWHALGAMKKFSKSILDMPEGKSSEIAKLMKMHEGYDYIFTSSEASRPAFAEAFGYPEDKLTIMSLPRVDALLDKDRDKTNRENIVKRYPQLGSKKNIVYAPTLRINKDMTDALKNLINAIDNDKYNLVVKMHPLTEISDSNVLGEDVIVDKAFQTMEMLSIADYVITDYSAITYEVALKNLPIFFYAFDKDEYLSGRSFYLDYESEMPGPICLTAEEVVKEIESDNNAKHYRDKEIAFTDKYIEKKDSCTKEIADLIEQLLNK